MSAEDTLVFISELMAGLFAVFAIAVTLAVALTHSEDESSSRSHG